jgi:5-methylthioadenosine/S-adenosylhomocysteine deaminase
MSLLLAARWVLPIHARPIAYGAVRVEDGRILWVGRETDLPPWGGPEERIDLGEAALLPGLVNAHSHLELTAFRGLCEAPIFEGWLEALIEAKYARFPAAGYAASSRWGVIEAIRAGVTTVGDGSDSGTVPGALIEGGLRGVVYREVFGPDESEAERSIAGLEEGLAGDLARATGRVRPGISPHSPYTASARLLRKAADLAREKELPLMVHAAESLAEESFLREGRGPLARRLEARGIRWTPPRASAVKYLSDLGVLGPRTLLVHMVNAGGDDIDLVLASGAAVAHCPRANAKLSHGIARAADMIARGVPVGLGTDGVPSNNVCDVLGEARAAVLFQRALRTENARALGAEAALRLATIGGARALGLEDRIGTLEPGKLADLCAVDLSGAHLQPVHDVEAALVFSASARDVVLTVVEGEVLYRDGRVLSLDEDAAREELRRAVAAMEQEVGGDATPL